MTWSVSGVEATQPSRSWVFSKLVSREPGACVCMYVCVGLGMLLTILFDLGGIKLLIRFLGIIAGVMFRRDCRLSEYSLCLL